MRLLISVIEIVLKSTNMHIFFQPTYTTLQRSLYCSLHGLNGYRELLRFYPFPLWELIIRFLKNALSIIGLRTPNLSPWWFLSLNSQSHIAFTVCAVATYMSLYWNRLIMPEKCRNPTFDRQPMIRTAGSWSSFGEVVELLMRKYSWYHLVTISDMTEDTSNICPHGLSAILHWFATSNYSITHVEIQMSTNVTDEDINFHLNAVEKATKCEWYTYL